MLAVVQAVQSNRAKRLICHANVIWRANGQERVRRLTLTLLRQVPPAEKYSYDADREARLERVRIVMQHTATMMELRAELRELQVQSLMESRSLCVIHDSILSAARTPNRFRGLWKAA